jgi:hypothetical protein
MQKPKAQKKSEVEQTYMCMGKVGALRQRLGSYNRTSTSTIGLLFHPEDGISRLLRNICNDPPSYTSSHHQATIVFLLYDNAGCMIL